MKGTRRTKAFGLVVALMLGTMLLPQQATASDLVGAELPFVGTHKISGNWYGEGTHNLASSSGIDADKYALDWNLNYDDVYPIKDGTVSHRCAASTCTTGYGKYIVVNHGSGLYSLYAHLSQVNVAIGASVCWCTPMAVSGNTGNSSGAHLHLHVMKKSGSTYYAHKPEPMSCYSSFPHNHSTSYSWPC